MSDAEPLSEAIGAAAFPAPREMLRMEDLAFARRLLAFGFLMVAEFFYGWAWNSVDVLRPAIRDSLHLSLTQAGSGYSGQGAGALIGAVVIGQLADRFGRRTMLMIVMIGYGLSLIAGTVVASYPAFLLERFVLGLFMGGIFPIVVGIYVSLFDGRVRGRLSASINAIFSSSILALGLAFGALGGHDWRLLLWIGGVPPILLSGLAMAAIPGQRRYRPFGASAIIAPMPKLPVLELFARGVRRQTLLLAAMTGLNFFAYQAFSGWFTTYLKDVRHLDAGTIGSLVAWQFGGNIVGCFFWGWAADRFGRRPNALGFALAAVAIVGFLLFPTDAGLLVAIGATYGFMIATSVIWGPWIAELYPVHLRSTAASIFNWGRIVSFFAPLITGTIAGAFGLKASMLVASAGFIAAGLIWISLPETLGAKRREADQA